MNKVVSLLGKGESGKQCPFDTEVWGANSVYKEPWCKKVDILFGEDDIDEIKELAQYAKEKNIPFASTLDYATVSLKDIDFKSDYLKATLDYMLAYAIHQNYNTIFLYGFDLLDNGFYFEQKARAEYWLGRAHQADIITILPPESQLLKKVNYEGRMKVFANYLKDIESKLALNTNQMEHYRLQGDYRTTVRLMIKLGLGNTLQDQLNGFIVLNKALKPYL